MRTEHRLVNISGAYRNAGSVLLQIVLPIVGLALVVGGWWWYTIAFDVPTIILPSPPEVVEALGQPSFLFEHARVTMAQSAIGFGIAVASGVMVGGVIAHSRVVNQMTYPWLVAFNAVPKVALAPLLVVWLGFGMQPRIALAVLVCFFPVVLATVTGLRATPAELAELARSLDASRLQTFVKVRFPNALPQIFIGLKVALPLAIIGSVIGELQGGRTGLGFVIKQASTDKAVAFAALVLLAVISIVMYYLLVALERLLLPWVRATTAQ
jgi:NitT/TauT family transport system permease protein